MKILKAIFLSIFFLTLTFSSPTTIYAETCAECHAACQDNPANTPLQIQRINSCKQYCNQNNALCISGGGISIGGGSGSGSGGNNGGSGGGQVSTNIESHLNQTGLFKFTSLGGFLKNFIQIALALGSIASLIWVFWGGIEFIMSGGNQDKAKAAKEKITQALFGLATLASLWILWRIITYFLGISSSAQGPFNIQIPSP